MRYVRQSDNAVIHINEVRKSHPNVSLPEGGDASCLGYERLIEALRPAPLLWHTVEEAPPLANARQWVQLPMSEAMIEATFTAALEAHYDNVAQSRRYDNRLTCALRAGYPGPFQPEGSTFAVWMDNCNAYAYQQLGVVKSGQRPMPTVEELIAELPSIVWPS